MSDVDTYTDANGVEYCDRCKQELGYCACLCETCGENVHECACEED